MKNAACYCHVVFKHPPSDERWGISDSESCVKATRMLHDNSPACFFLIFALVSLVYKGTVAVKELAFLESELFQCSRYSLYFLLCE